MNDHTNGSENNEASISEGSENQRPYRVQLEAQVLVSIEVYARSVSEARAKAFSWTGDYPSGVSVVGDYYVGENEEPDCDLGEMYWNIENVSPEDILNVVEFEQRETDTGFESPFGESVMS